MKKRLILAILFMFSHSFTYGELVITEVYFEGYYEWIELTNFDAPVSGNYVLSGVGSSETLIYITGLDIGESIVIYDEIPSYFTSSGNIIQSPNGLIINDDGDMKIYISKNGESIDTFLVDKQLVIPYLDNNQSFQKVLYNNEFIITITTGNYSINTQSGYYANPFMFYTVYDKPIDIEYQQNTPLVITEFIYANGLGYIELFNNSESLFSGNLIIQGQFSGLILDAFIQPFSTYIIGNYTGLLTTTNQYFLEPSSQNLTYNALSLPNGKILDNVDNTGQSFYKIAKNGQLDSLNIFSTLGNTSIKNGTPGLIVNDFTTCTMPFIIQKNINSVLTFTTNFSGVLMLIDEYGSKEFSGNYQSGQSITITGGYAIEKLYRTTGIFYDEYVITGTDYDSISNCTSLKNSTLNIEFPRIQISNTEPRYAGDNVFIELEGVTEQSCSFQFSGSLFSGCSITVKGDKPGIYTLFWFVSGDIQLSGDYILNFPQRTIYSSTSSFDSSIGTTCIFTGSTGFAFSTGINNTTGQSGQQISLSTGIVNNTGLNLLTGKIYGIEPTTKNGSESITIGLSTPTSGKNLFIQRFTTKIIKKTLKGNLSGTLILPGKYGFPDTGSCIKLYFKPLNRLLDEFCYSTPPKIVPPKKIDIKEEKKDSDSPILTGIIQLDSIDETLGNIIIDIKRVPNPKENFFLQIDKQKRFYISGITLVEGLFTFTGFKFPNKDFCLYLGIKGKSLPIDELCVQVGQELTQLDIGKIHNIVPIHNKNQIVEFTYSGVLSKLYLLNQKDGKKYKLGQFSGNTTNQLSGNFGLFTSSGCVQLMSSSDFVLDNYCFDFSTQKQLLSITGVVFDPNVNAGKSIVYIVYNSGNNTNIDLSRYKLLYKKTSQTLSGTQDLYTTVAYNSKYKYHSLSGCVELFDGLLNYSVDVFCYAFPKQNIKKTTGNTSTKVKKPQKPKPLYQIELLFYRSYVSNLHSFLKSTFPNLVQYTPVGARIKLFTILKNSISKQKTTINIFDKTLDITSFSNIYKTYYFQPTWYYVIKHFSLILGKSYLQNFESIYLNRIRFLSKK